MGGVRDVGGPADRSGDAETRAPPSRELLPPGSLCTIENLQQRADLNGTEVTVRRYDSPTGRFVCDPLLACGTLPHKPLKVKQNCLSFKRRVRFTLAEVEAWVERCAVGQRLYLPAGNYGNSPETADKSAEGLLLTKPIALAGAEYDPAAEEENARTWSAPRHDRSSGSCAQTVLDFGAKFDFSACSFPEASFRCSDISFSKSVLLTGAGALRSCTLLKLGIIATADDSTQELLGAWHHPKLGAFGLVLSSWALPEELAERGRILIEDCTIANGPSNIKERLNPFPENMEHVQIKYSDVDNGEEEHDFLYEEDIAEYVKEQRASVCMEAS
eukprot:g14539.t1